MSPKSIQFVGEVLSSEDTKSIATCLKKNLVQVLSIRDCEINDKDLKTVLRAVGKSTSILQLGLSIGVIHSDARVQMLAQAISRNKSITGLFLHGNDLGGDNIDLLTKSILESGRLEILDIGDCQLGEESMSSICQLVTPKPHWSGIKDLSLSANPNISSNGWREFSLALAKSRLRSLYLDYNPLGDDVGVCLIVGVSGCQSLEVLDLERTSITHKTAQLVLKLVESYPSCLRRISMIGNKISRATVEEVNSYFTDLTDEETGGSDAELLSLISQSTLTEVKHAEVKVQTSSAEGESGNDTDVTNRESSLHSELVGELEKKMSNMIASPNSENISKDTEDDFGDELKEIPVYYSGIPVTY